MGIERGQYELAVQMELSDDRENLIPILVIA